MKVLFVNPEFPDTYWSFRHALPFERKRCAFPPLGLLTVSALLPKSWERRLVDLNVRPLKSATIQWADIVFVTGMLVQKESVHEVVRRCKQQGKRVVLGGPYVTTTIEDLPAVDHIFRGEAETTLPQFIEDLERGQTKRTYQAAERPPLATTPVADFSLADMQRAGFRRVFLGIETPVEESLKEAQKSQNRGNLLDSVKRIQSYGMEVMAGFIVGFDNDPEDIFERQIKFIRDSAIPLAMVGLLTALPDTQLWRRLEKEGRLLGESSGNNTNCSLNFVPKMDATRLVEGYKSIMRTIYKPSEYYQRALESLKRTTQKDSEPTRLDIIGALAAFSRLVIKLGVVDRERQE